MLPILLSFGVALAQTVPPMEPLRSIDTEQFKLIYPASAEPLAQEAMALLMRVAPVENAGFDVDPDRLPVLLYNRYSLPNGYVTLAPRYSGWFTVPFVSTYPGDFGTSTPWLEALAIHEYRHVTQFQHLRVGLTKAAWFVAGQYGWAAGAGLAAPAWFYEGDAVMTETAMSESGRGRTPGFVMDERTLVLERGAPFSYEKMRLGSLRDPIPNHYPFGYLLVVEGERLYDPDIWKRVTERSARNPLRPWAFHAALRAETGMSAAAFQEYSFLDLSRVWQDSQAARMPFLGVEPIGPAPRPIPGSTLSACPQPDGSVIAFHRSYEDTGSVVRVWADGREETLAKTGFRASERVSAAGGRVVWDEIEPHPRWALASYSVIRSLDLETGKSHVITHRSRLFSPSLSTDGRTVAALEIGLANEMAMVLLDADTGEERGRFPAPEGEELLSPRYATDGGAIVAVGRRSGVGTGVLRLDLGSGLWSEVVPHQHAFISDPAAYGSRVLYTSGEAGVEDLWLMETATGQRYRVGTRPYGALSAAFSADGQRVVFSDHQYWGAALVSARLDPSAWTPAESVADLSQHLIDPLVSTQRLRPEGGLLSEPAHGDYASERYRRFLHPFGVFAWSPVGEPLARSVGAQVFSMDRTQSISSSLAATWNVGERGGQLKATVGLLSLPVEVYADAAVGQRAIGLLDQDTLEITRATWSETSGSVDLRLPLDLSRGNWSRYLNFDLGAEVLVAGEAKVDPPGVTLAEGTLDAGTAFPVTLTVSTGQSVQQATRELAPRWSQSLTLTATDTPFGGDLTGRQASAFAGFGLPGFLRLDHFSLAASVLARSGDADQLSRPVAFARGYTPPDQPLQLVAGLDYHVPLAYPDLSLGGLFYLQRVSAGLFGDVGLGLEDSSTALYRTAGAELGLDANFMRLAARLQFGARVGWAFDDQAPFIEPALGVAF